MTGDEQDVMQQFEEAGEELQEDQIDAVLERCEQLSLKLRQALQSQGTDRCYLAACKVLKQPFVCFIRSDLTFMPAFCE